MKILKIHMTLIEEREDSTEEIASIKRSIEIDRDSYSYEWRWDEPEKKIKECVDVMKVAIVD